jgi:transposase
MATSYSLDLRMRVIQAYINEEGSQSEIAEQFKISLTSLRRYWNQYQQTGKIEIPKYYPGRKAKINSDRLKTVEAIVTAQPDITLKELCRAYQKRYRVKVHESTMSKACKKLKLRYKKKRLYAQEQEREDIKKS